MPVLDIGVNPIRSPIRKQLMQINILGQVYTILKNVDPAKDSSLKDRHGYCDVLQKLIVIADHSKINGWEDECDNNKELQVKTTLRHEIYHAFFYESGLWGSTCTIEGWSVNEEMIDWLAIQSPKIYKAFGKAGCI